MSIRLRHRRLSSLLGCLALLAQLWLPTLHAQNWARQNGDPLLYTLCGHLNPALAAQLRSVTPAEVLRALEQRQAKKTPVSCPLCLSVHAGGHLVASADVVWTDAPAAEHTVPGAAATRPVAAYPLRRPPPRGPPASPSSIS